MRRLFLFLFVTMFAFSCSSDDDGASTQCTNILKGEYISLTSQAEVDAFAAHGYCGVKGILSIGKTEEEPSDITDLSGLATLVHIDGYIAIHDNPNLVNLQGLHNIIMMTALGLERNDALVNLNGLTSLRLLTKGLSLRYNKSLESLEGLGPITEMEAFGALSNPKLRSLEALSNIQIKGGQILIGVNKLLTNLKGLEKTTEVGSVSILYNDALQSLEGLQNLHSVSDISIDANSSLLSISHLSGLTTITNNLFAESSLSIGGNDILTSLNGLQNIINFKGKIRIEFNYKLKDFCALKNVVEYATFFSVIYNAFNPTAVDVFSGNCSR